MGASRADAPDARQLSRAIERAGFTGITAKQLATQVKLPAERVERQLRRLEARRSIVRHGRGLWALARYADGAAPGPTFRGPEWYTRDFEREFGARLSSARTEIQFGPNEQRPVHRWWPYIQGFSAGFVEETLRRYGVGPGSVVLDPFCGSGTVPTVARSLGARAIGVDLMPIAAFVSRAKNEWGVDPGALRAGAVRVLARRGAARRPPPFLRETRRQFAAPVLRSLLRLRENVAEEADPRVRTLLELCFASLLIDASRLKRSPCLGYTAKGRQTAETPYRLFAERAEVVAGDLEELASRRDRWGPPAEIHLGSSGSVALPAGSVDLAVTSPPYVNGMDYVMNYKIDLAWMGLAHSYADLAQLRSSMVACDNIPRAVATGHRPSAAVRGDRWRRAIAREIDRNIRRKGTYRRNDMAHVVTKYFDDLVPVIRNVFRALRPGGRFVVVNGDSLIAGTYVPGDLLFARLAVAEGFAVESVEVARSRRSGQRRGFVLRESVLTLGKPAAGA